MFQVISDSESGHVWTFVYPGCHIFQWSAGKELETTPGKNLVPFGLWSQIVINVLKWSQFVTGNSNAARSIKNRLDCSKLVPSSESLKTIAIDEHFSPGRCQVISRNLQFKGF